MVSRRVASTVDVICSTVGQRSTSKRRETVTLPVHAMRPRSFRVRSTIITFSARSSSGAARAAARALSSAGQRPRRAVPFMGFAIVRSPRRSKKNSRGGKNLMAAGMDARSIAPPLRGEEPTIRGRRVASAGDIETNRVFHLVYIAAADHGADLFDGARMLPCVVTRTPLRHRCMHCRIVSQFRRCIKCRRRFVCHKAHGMLRPRQPRAAAAQQPPSTSLRARAMGYQKAVSCRSAPVMREN